MFFRREDSTEKRVQRAKLNDEIDQKFGYERYKDPQDKVGWLINMHPVYIFKLTLFLENIEEPYYISCQAK